MLTRYARPIEIALGVLFIVSAALKALDVYGFGVQIAAYGIVRDRSITIALAYTMIALEGILGAALLGGFRFGGATIACTSGLLLGFTALIAYAWAFKGLADCGCFGAYVKMGPGASIAKNVALLALAWAVWRGTRTSPAEAAINVDETTPTVATATRNSNRRAVLAGLGMLAVVGALLMGKPAPVVVSNPTPPPNNPKAAAAKFAAFVPDLGGAPVPLAQGDYFVALLSASCDHCRAVAASLNELAQQPEVPQVTALMLGTEDEMKEFRAATDPQFPIQTLEAFTFMELLADGVSAPPDFFIIHDGAVVRHMAAEEPDYDRLLKFATEGGETPPAENQ